jgi:hypothetical protein
MKKRGANKDVVLFKSPERIHQAITDVDRQERLVYQYLNKVRDNYTQTSVDKRAGG